MSNIFNNLDPAEQIVLSKNDGWESTTKYDKEKRKKIKDTIEGGGIGYFKLGTSIPTPFARIMMFDHAFQSLTDMNDDSTIYGKLVSECLDFIEFVYHYGQEIEIKKWSFKDDINLLKGIAAPATTPAATGRGTGFDDIFDSAGTGAAPAPAPGTPVDGHALLADCLLNKRNELKDIDNIYLIYYHGTLMGGTSPFTLFFTSPNWQRRKNCGTVKGDAGNELFPNYQEDKVKGTPLHRRDIAFIQFMMMYRRSHGAGVKDCSLIDYIDNDMPYIVKSYPSLADADNKLKGMGAAGVTPLFNSKYQSMEDGAHAPVYAKDIVGAQQLPLAYIKAAVITGSDYTVMADYANFEQIERDSAGNVVGTHTIEKVMVLNEAGLRPIGGTQANYIGGHPWDSNNYTIDPNIANVALYDRVLPGPGNHPQPFITVYDLFEDYIVQLPYTLNSDRFYTYVERDWNYLLPVKKLFFCFFKKERLNAPNIFSISESDGKVTCRLNIPVTFNPGGAGVQQYLCLEKEYDAAHVMKLEGSSLFAMALFPAYRVMNDDTANFYSLMVGTATVPVDLNFYSTADPQNAFRNEVESEERPDDIKARFYRVSRAFDFIEITATVPDKARPVRALIIPHLHEAYLDDAKGSPDALFSIDFGTTNTYIAAMNAGKPVTFQIDENDMQVAFLDKIDYNSKFGSEDYKKSINKSKVPVFHAAAHREFAPMLLGENGIANYPFQTVTCESNTFKNADGKEKHLFSHLSIGYNLNNEKFSQNYVYRTDIKWATSNGTPADILVAKDRMRLYCKQIAWMLKNKVAMDSKSENHKKKQFKVFYTYPCSMGIVEVGNLKTLWQNAFGPDVTLEDMTESEAPYYYLTRNGDISAGRNFLNIDIGGGTTDMFFVIQETVDGHKQKNSYYTSMRFAGNDLWGDGVDGTARLTNGFYNRVKEGMGWLKSDIARQEELVIGSPDSKMTSADTMAFLFRNDKPDSPAIPELIKADKQLYPLLFVHFGAIMYHVAMILKEKNWDIPATINLTGMGSKYVYIIHQEEEVVSHLAGLLLKKFTGKDLPEGFKLTYSKENAKQITAQGALMRDLGFTQHVIDGTPTQFQIYGTKTAATESLTFEDADKIEVRQQVIERYKQFVDEFLADSTIISDLITNYGVEISDNLVKQLKGLAEDSYDLVSDSFTTKKIVISETLFFWPLKNAIYEISKK